MAHRLIPFIAVFCLMTSVSLANDGAVSIKSLQDALQNNQIEQAFAMAETLYASSQKTNPEAAGFAAYVKASLLERQDAHVEAGKAYSDCGDQYASLGSAAQAIQCDYKAGLAYLNGYRSGRALSVLKDVAKRLEALGQDQSAIAGELYLTLAQETLPAKMDFARSAQSERRQAAAYADQSIAAMIATGQKTSERYAAVQFIKGMALEDAHEYESAADAYAVALAVYTATSDPAEDTLRQMATRLRIAKAGGEDTASNQIKAQTADGRDVTLMITKRKLITIPRINRNQRIDGAKARIKITLSETGDVAQIDILESSPSPDFGDALEKAVKTWTFSPPDGLSPEDIPPFEYGMIFYVKRL